MVIIGILIVYLNSNEDGLPPYDESVFVTSKDAPDIVIRINPAKKDGTRSNRLFVLFGMEIDSIKKID